MVVIGIEPSKMRERCGSIKGYPTKLSMDGAMQLSVRIGWSQKSLHDSKSVPEQSAYSDIFFGIWRGNEFQSYL